ncbi:DNA repair protein XRCC2 [Salvia divinorum]|uniref:DNA repair protein XRCC2 n=1 Tax=Salvia divinorum TaxID=28513 RepID=A0ABD1GGA6_SALDI
MAEPLAFYWMDRALPASSIGNNNKQEEPLPADGATKSAAFGDKQSITEVIRNGLMRRHWIQEGLKTNHIVLPCHQCGGFCSNPQSFVLHQMLLCALDSESKHQKIQDQLTFSTECTVRIALSSSQI